VFPSSARFVVDGAIASLTFNRPEAMNALTWEMYDALAHACDRVDFDRASRVFIVKGHGGKAFAAGTDISQFTSLTTGEDAIAYERRLDAVVARLEGVAAATIAFACDLRVCTPNARFGVPIARTLGNCLSAANCARMLDLVGPTLLKDLLFTGRFMDAAEASRLGLITRMAEPAGVDQATSELAALIVANAPLTIQATKETVRRIEVGRRIDQAAIDDLIVSCYTSGDFRNAVIAFLDKRPPSFTGR
jgi:enoyl-CoA hydratase/carnithine racemase